MITSSEMGTVSWSADDMRAALSEFAELYRRRPIQDNIGGMKSPHMFLSWFVLRKLQPTTIVESGVFMGRELGCLSRRAPMRSCIASKSIQTGFSIDRKRRPITMSTL